MKLFSRFCLFVIIISVAGCKKNNNNSNSSGVPLVAVNISLYINNPSYLNLNAVGGWVYVPNIGVRGLLVYRASSTDFKAYDRNCTYKSTSAYPCATVSVDATKITAVDSCCKSKFSIVDGSVENGPATFPLKAYNTTFDGNVLNIFN